MDRPRHNDQLAVKKIGKKIKKTPLHLPSLATGKNWLRRSIVPQITSPPAALTQINRPHDVPPPAMAHPTLTLASRPTMMGHADQSPISVSLQSSSGLHGNQMQQSHQYQSHSPLIRNKSLLPSAGGVGILPTPPSSFGDSGPSRNQMQPSQQPPRFNGSASSVPILPSPRFGGPGILPTPPRGAQYPSPLKARSFTSSSSMAQGGILGPGKFPHASTGLVFPASPFEENTN